MGTMSFHRQLLVLQTVVMLIIVLGAGATAAWVQERVIRDAYVDRMIGVAQSVAQLPVIRNALDHDEPSLAIQPIAEVVREASDVTYVVVTDADGIRFSHPNAALIGDRVSTEPDAIETGEMFVGTQTGTLGESWRVKVPIIADDGTVIGQVSVGTLESQLRSDFVETLWWLLAAIGIAAVIGVVLNAWLARYLRKRIFDLEPAEIKEMLDLREATLHGIAEGVVVTDEDRTITLANDAALRLLDVENEDELIGERLEHALDIDLAVTDQQVALVGERILLVRSHEVDVRGTRVGHAIILVDHTELDGALRELHGVQTANDSLRAQQHEFANTLHTIQGLIELGESESARKVVESAGSGGALGDLTAQAGILDPEVAAMLLGKRARAKELGIRFEVADGAYLTDDVGADPVARPTILGNLIDNAFEAVGLDGTVLVRLDADEEQVSMVVEDSGAGIAEHMRDRIFELRVSGKAQGAGKSHGLAHGFGLALVKRLVTRAGGSVSVGDSPLGGAAFRVTMPTMNNGEG
ncbi:MAG TPA: sensor histidine kinase [Candidatus Agrococcus pullicola]|uniref:histidine kinase n=1 Tax=Candidatus Agrococcus pullicola TaxID=2838429 RepID=A0A9D1YWB8_9MICO|nr:sensor histidine kinase [Candidatus Agrococcus pullicola]